MIIAKELWLIEMDELTVVNIRIGTGSRGQVAHIHVNPISIVDGSIKTGRSDHVLADVAIEEFANLLSCLVGFILKWKYVPKLDLV